MKQDQELYVFSHIPKTAGSFFITNIKKSNPQHYLMHSSFSYFQPFKNQHTGKTDFYLGKEHYIDYVKSLSPAQKNKIHCIAGHDAYYGIHTLFDRPAKYITFVREPISRTISHYNYVRMLVGVLDKMRNKNHFHVMLNERIVEKFMIDGKIPDFETWLHHVYKHHHIFYNTMSDYLQYLNFIDENRDESSFQDALKKFHFVGVTESFYPDADYLYHQLNVKTSIGKGNTSPGYVNRNSLSSDVINQIRDLNKDDLVLYECALRENSSFKKENKNFYIDVAKSKRIRRFFYPWEWTKKTSVNLLKSIVRPVLVQMGLR